MFNEKFEIKKKTASQENKNKFIFSIANKLFSIVYNLVIDTLELKDAVLGGLPWKWVVFSLKFVIISNFHTNSEMLRSNAFELPISFQAPFQLLIFLALNFKETANFKFI